MTVRVIGRRSAGTGGEAIFLLKAINRYRCPFIDWLCSRPRRVSSNACSTRKNEDQSRIRVAPWFSIRSRYLKRRPAFARWGGHRELPTEFGGWSGRLQTGTSCPGPPRCLPARGISRTSRRGFSTVAQARPLYWAGPTLGEARGRERFRAWQQPEEE